MGGEVKRYRRNVVRDPNGRYDSMDEDVEGTWVRWEDFAASERAREEAERAVVPLEDTILTLDHELDALKSDRDALAATVRDVLKKDGVHGWGRDQLERALAPVAAAVCHCKGTLLSPSIHTPGACAAWPDDSTPPTVPTRDDIDGMDPVGAMNRPGATHDGSGVPRCTIKAYPDGTVSGLWHRKRSQEESWTPACGDDLGFNGIAYVQEQVTCPKCVALVHAVAAATAPYTGPQRRKEYSNILGWLNGGAVNVYARGPQRALHADTRKERK